MRNLRIGGLFALLFTAPIAAQDVYRMSPQITAPKAVVTTPMPRRTRAAAEKGIEGDVELEIDVMSDGSVGTVALVKSLDPELDAAAAQAVKKWKFTPGTKDGKPVAVRTVVNLTFAQR